MKEARLATLIDAHLDGTLTTAEAEELSNALVEKPEVRRRFWEHAALHGLAQEAAQLEWLGTAGPAIEGNVVRVAWWRWAVPLAAAAMAMLAMTWWLRTPQVRTSAEGVALISRLVGVEWADATEARANGAVLAPGMLRPKSGAALLEFYSGASVIVEGPAEFSLVAAGEGFLRRGKITAHVPPQARGFKVGSPALTVVDLGTEFGLSVPESAPAEVHVFTGKVEVLRADAPTSTRALNAGEGVRADAGAWREIPAKRTAFLDATELARRDSTQARARYAAWRNASASLGSDPAAIVHFTFEDQPASDRVLTNRAATAPDSTHGSIVGCEWVEGRWPGKRALEFRGEGDRVRLDVETPLPAVSYLAWVRVEALPHQTHSLFAAETERPGALRWTLTGRGDLRIGVARESGRPEANWEALNSAGAITPARFGQWVMLASVFDGKRMSHYVDGRLVASAGAAGPVPLVIGPVELGNWGVTRSHPEFQWVKNRGADFFARGFHGRIDEFALLSRALTADEIHHLYEVGRPDAPEPAAAK